MTLPKSKSLPLLLLGLLGCLSQHRAPAAAAFTVDPAISTNLADSTIQLSVTQTSQSVTQAYNFQWSRNGTNLVEGGRLTGVQSPTLTILNAQVEDTAKYIVAFTAAFATGGVAQVALTSMVYVVETPAILSVSGQTFGDDVVFQGVATGGLLSYQWLWQGSPLSGATTTALRFTNAFSSANAGYYSLLVTNPVGSVTSSLPGLLFTKPAPSGTYQGLFYGDVVAPESSGSFQYSLSSSKRSFSGKLYLGKTSYSFSGTFSPAHDAVASARRSKMPSLTLALQLLTTNDLPQVIGTVTGPGWTAALWGPRNYFSSKNPTALAGRYTLVMQNTNAGTLAPNGHGYAAAMVRPQGTVVFSGQAADGATLSPKASLSRLGDCPFYMSLYRERGVVLGWLRFFTQSGTNNLQGSPLAWVKNPGPDQFYPGGFALTLPVEGSRFVLPANNAVFGLTNPVAAFYGGDLVSADLAVWSFQPAVLADDNVFRATEGDQAFRVSFKKSDGRLTGQFTDFVTGRKTALKGIVLQQKNAARGYFLSGNASGAFNLEAGR